MNYFTFYNLPVSPNLDKKELRKLFYVKSRASHPDFQVLKDQDARDNGLEQTALNNRAYKTLLDEDSRLKHLLEVRGVLGEEGSNTVPQDFLLEIMEVNEALMELEFDDDPLAKTKVNALIEGLETGLHGEVATLLREYDDATVTESELAKLRDYYLKRRYLLRLKNKL